MDDVSLKLFVCVCVCVCVCVHAGIPVCNIIIVCCDGVTIFAEYVQTSSFQSVFLVLCVPRFTSEEGCSEACIIESQLIYSKGIKE